VIAATNEDLRLAVENKTFREDLFYRLNVFPIQIPPLRDRTEDISILSEYFLQRHCRIHRRTITGFSEQAIDTLMEYAWPGNVRELENIIERAVILAADNQPIKQSHLAEIALKKPSVRHLLYNGQITMKAGVASQPSITDEKRMEASILPYQEEQTTITLEAVLSNKIRSAIKHHHGNLAAAARELGISRAQIAYRARKLGLENLCRRRS
jgi:transcriptional regulator with GAF, ATPase, and Fis domain